MNVRDMIADVPTALFTGGQWRLPSHGGAFPVIDPATEQLVAMVSSGTEADAIDAVGSAPPPWRVGGDPASVPKSWPRL